MMPRLTRFGRRSRVNMEQIRREINLATGGRQVPRRLSRPSPREIAGHLRMVIARGRRLHQIRQAPEVNRMWKACIAAVAAGNEQDGVA